MVRRRHVGILVAVILGASVVVPREGAGLVVTNLANSGPGSLRQAVIDAPSGDTITFAVTGSINLLSNLTISKNLTIQGPAAPGITIANRTIISLVPGLLTLENLTIQTGGILHLAGAIAVNRCRLSNNGTALSLVGGTGTVTDSRVEGSGLFGISRHSAG